MRKALAIAIAIVMAMPFAMIKWVIVVCLFSPFCLFLLVTNCNIIFLLSQCFIDVPSDAPSDVPSDQPSSVPSLMPSDIPSGE